METKPGEGDIRLMVLTDGRAGNEAQALGLAEALARRRPARIAVHRAALSGARAWPTAAAWATLGRAAPGLARALLGGLPQGPAPDLVIGAGRRAAPLVALAGRRWRCPTVQLLHPQMPASAFDLVVAPAHDGLSGPNVLTSLGSLGRVTPERIAAEAAAWSERIGALPRPRLAVLIGGPGRMAAWRPGDAERLRAALRALAEAGWTLLVTTSRRSDAALVAGLESDLASARHLLFTGAGPNPYPGMLGHAEAVLVTEDSVNMASEAASSGLPLHVFRLPGAAAKARAFHAALAARGIARDFAGEIGRWRSPPLAEADRLAGEVESRLLPPAGPRHEGERFSA